jgi:hypothetical protein
MCVNNTELPGDLTIENCTFGNITYAAIHSTNGSNLITCTNTVFIGNGSDNQYANFAQSGFTYCAFGADSLNGYASSDEAVNASAFVNASGNNFQEVTTGTTTIIGKGTTLSNVTVDYLGNARPSGAYDIGAYQYVSGYNGNVGLIKELVNYLKGTVTPSPTDGTTQTNTATPTVTQTPSCTPTATGLLQSVVAGPNVSKNGEPIKFMVNLGFRATIQLNLYSLTGEEVYSQSVQGNSGINTLLWLLRNNGQSPVASGLYIYAVQVNDGYEIATKTGKLLVLH